MSVFKKVPEKHPVIKDLVKLKIIKKNDVSRIESVSSELLDKINSHVKIIKLLKRRKMNRKMSEECKKLSGFISQLLESFKRLKKITLPYEVDNFLDKALTKRK